MSWLKTFILTGAMAVVAYGVWATLNKRPEADEAGASSDDAQWRPARLRHGSKKGKAHLAAKAHAPAAADGSAVGEPVTLHAPAAVEGDAAPSIPPLPPDDPAGDSPALAAENDTTDGAGQDPQVDTGVKQAAATNNGATAEESLRQQGRLYAQFDQMMEKAKGMLSDKQLAQAHFELSQWYHRREALNEGRRALLLDLLDRLTGTVVYSRRHLLAEHHTVQATETLPQIAQPYKVTPELLAKINGIHDPTQLRTGQTLKVVTGPFDAHVDLSEFELTLFLPDGRYAGRFRIGVGQEVPLKERVYQVTKKAHDPAYGNDTPGGDPYNPLGRKLVEFVDKSGGGPAEKWPYGAFHGTIDEQSVGKPCQEGCLRLTPGDIDDLFDILTDQGSRVIVKE